MKQKILKIALSIMLVIPMYACKSSNTDSVKDGTIVISGDLTYEKMMEAMKPLMTLQKKALNSTEGYETIQVDDKLCGFDVCFVTKVTYIQSTKHSAKILIPEKFKNIISTSYQNGIVSVKTKGTATSNNHEELTLVIECPYLKTIKLSGASSTFIETLKQDEDLSVQCVGACQMSVSSFENQGTMNININGASNVVINQMKCTDSFIKVNGASNCVLNDATTNNLKFDVNGASKTTINGNFNNIEANTNGCSKMTIKGKANYAKLKADAVSKIDASNLNCKNFVTNNNNKIINI